MKMVKVYHNLSIFAVFLKNRNIISKIRRSKVTDYAVLILIKCITFTLIMSRFLKFKTVTNKFDKFAIFHQKL